jgi:hypothetical protein
MLFLQLEAAATATQLAGLRDLEPNIASRAGEVR